ncbi:MAG: AraC family transcriptional regulator [Clostridia bacterium]|nr:AraC family transcriptional regulator [Clostridia bacterium]
MKGQLFKLEDLKIRPIVVHLYVPPIVWKGDSVGHIGNDNIFFWVLEGECFLHIDSESYVVRPGQLAFLPKGKMRAYTHASERFSMYEMAFDVKANGEEIMGILGLSEGNYVVDVPDVEEMSSLFESSHRKELFKNPLYDVAWCANIINIIRIYAEQRQKQGEKDNAVFKAVLDYMSKNIDKTITTEDLASLVYMQPTYFIKKFRKIFGIPPMAYFNRMKIHKAMGMLAGTDLTIEQISKEIGIFDTSYFARVLKKHCGVTPTEYRAEFKKNKFDK